MPTKLQPQFVAIAWEDAGEEGTPVTVQAVLCLRHRREIGLQHPTARGWGQFGEACDLCEGRGLRTEPNRSLTVGEAASSGSLTVSRRTPAALGACRAISPGRR